MKTRNLLAYLLALISLLLMAGVAIHRYFVFPGENRLVRVDDVVLDGKEAFNGWAIETASDSFAILPFRDGKLGGMQLDVANNGRLLSIRHFSSGQKVGVHRGWYADGQRRFYYEFDNNQHHGDAWEWQTNGLPYLYQRFEHGREIGQKIWRSDGKVHANYVTGYGTLHGLTGGKLCVTAPGDKS